MSTRPQLDPFAVIKDGDMSGDLVSAATIIKKISMFSYSFTWAGTAPAGTIAVEVSDDYTENVDGSVRNAGTWNPIILSAPTTVSGNTGKGLIDILQCGAYAVRVSYTRTSGTGLLQVRISGKVA